MNKFSLPFRKLQFVALYLLVFCLCNSLAFGQFYGRVGSGYAFPMDGQSLGYIGFLNGSQTMISYPSMSGTGGYDVITNVAIKSASFSAGTQGYLAFGYQLNKNIGIEIMDNTGIANRKFTYNYISGNFVAGTTSLSNYANIVTQGQHITVVVPAMVFTIDVGISKFYGRIGCALPVFTRVIMTQSSINSINSVTGYADGTYEIKNRFGFGMASGIGWSYPINERTRLWAEVSTLSLSIFGKEADLTQSNVSSGVTMASHLTFVQSGLISGNNLPSNTQPFSNVSTNGGISFLIGKKL